MKIPMVTTLMLASSILFVGCERPPQFEPSPFDELERSDESVGELCRFDTDCDGYLRCQDNSCQTPPAMTGEVRADTPRIVFRNQDGLVLAQFHLELALSRNEQARGLMYRDQMLDDWGMLFIYPEEDHLSFWMKNTLIPLDMIFIDDAGEVVGVVHEAEPQTLAPRSVEGMSRYVLEINGGQAAEYHIDSGARIDLQYVEASHLPRR